MAMGKQSNTKSGDRWTAAAKKFKLQAAHVLMGRQLRVNPGTFDKMAPGRNDEPWKKSIPQWLERKYVRAYGQARLEELFAAVPSRREKKRRAEPQAEPQLTEQQKAEAARERKKKNKQRLAHRRECQGMREEEAARLLDNAQRLHSAGESAKAIAVIGKALRGKHKTRSVKIRGYQLLADIHVEMRELEEAKAALEEAFMRARLSSGGLAEASVRLKLGAVLVELGETRRGLRFLHKARHIFSESGVGSAVVLADLEMFRATEGQRAA
jgi:tetratricopeptide (TPR) repeat protein